MELIKDNILKNRKVYKLHGKYRKEWSVVNFDLLEKHVSIMNKIHPGYILNYGKTNNIMWLEVAAIDGVLASTIPHTDEFVDQIVKFCLDNIRQTYPYAHGDWVLSNIIKDHNGLFHLIDWDNVDIYPIDIILQKLNQDLTSAFGDKFTGLEKYDTSSF